MKNEEALGVSEKSTSAELGVMLQKLSALSVTEGNLQIILNEIIDAAIAVTGADFGNIQLMDPVSSAVRIAAQRGFPQWWLDFWNNVPNGQGSCGVSLELEERVIVDDIEGSPIFAGAALEIQRRAGVRAVQSTPLISLSGKRIGMLSTHYKKPWRPDEGTLRSLDLIARQAADCVEQVQVIARLHESEERFRTMADGIPLMIWVSDADGHNRFINRSCIEFFGVTLEDSDAWQSLLHPDDAGAYVAEFVACLRDRRLFKAEARVKRRDGEWRWIESFGQPLFSSTGEFLGIAGSSTDISERKRFEDQREQLLAREQLARRQAETANEQLRESEEKYRALFDSIDEGFCVVEVLFDDMDNALDYRFLEVNRVFEKQTGISNAVGRRMREIAPAHEEHWFQIYGQIARTGESRRFENPALALGRFYDVYAFRVGRPEQRQVAILFNDITKRKQAEEALHRTQALNQAVLGSLAANIAVLDREGNIIAVNDAWKRFAYENGGAPVAAPVGANYLKACDGLKGSDEGRAVLNGIQAALDGTLQNFVLEYPCHSPSEKRWFLMSVAPLLGERGGAVVTHSDITERKQIEEALQESEERLQMAMEAGGIGTFDWNIRTNAVVWTEQSKGAFARPSRVSRGVYDDWAWRVRPEDRLVCEASIQEVFRKKHHHWQAEYRMASFDTGEERWINSQGHIFYDEQGEPLRMIGVNIDITERKQADEALRIVSAELRQTLHTAATGLIHCSRDLRYISANPAYAQWIGLPLEQIVGRPMVEVVGPAAFDMIRPRIERVLSGERVEYEDELPMAGGLKWIHVVYTPDRDGSGDVIGWVASVMDITERKRMEEERAQEARRKDEFLSLLGHELRNPLAAISTALQVLSGAVSGEMRASLNETIDRQLMLMRRLLDDLLDLGRITRGHIELKKERIDLAKFLQQVSVDAQQTAAKRRQEMILRFPAEAVTFNADELRLEQIAINLLSNASKYTPQGGRIEFSGNREGSEIVLRCKDNGRGILPEIQEKIFEPFKRVGPLTESHGEASLGIGLALVKRLVELHKGTVFVESAGPGMGSEFTVRLPLESAPSDQPAAPEGMPVSPSRSARSIVVVEDNPDVSRTMVAALQQAGYEVSSFADASSALAGLSSLKPHAVLIDIGLPGMDGCELARTLRKTQRLQDALLVGVSGFKRPDSGDDFDDFFTKPVDLPALLTLLDKPAPTRAMDVATEHRTLGKPKPLRVLLIEDHAGLSAAMVQLLRSEGFEVRAALSGKEGLEAAPDFEPDLTLCDLNLPDIGGLEVIRRLRSNSVTRNTYAVILTGLSNWEICAFNDEAKTLGIDEFIAKPITSEVISTLIATLERQRRP